MMEPSICRDTTACLPERCAGTTSGPISWPTGTHRRAAGLSRHSLPALRRQPYSALHSRKRCAMRYQSPLRRPPSAPSGTKVCTFLFTVAPEHAAELGQVLDHVVPQRLCPTPGGDRGAAHRGRPPLMNHVLATFGPLIALRRRAEVARSLRDCWLRAP